MHWTDDPALSGMTDEQVVHAQVWEELGTAVAEATDAYHRGLPDRTAALLGRAVALAHRAGARRGVAGRAGAAARPRARPSNLGMRHTWRSSA